LTGGEAITSMDHSYPQGALPESLDGRGKIVVRIKRAADFAAANRRLDERKAVDSHLG